MIAKIKELYEYRDMILGLVKRDLRGRYKGSVLGFAWNFITPLCQIVVYYVIFSYVFRSGIDNFQVYLVTGMIPWNFFSEAIVQGTGSIVSNADMTKKIYFPREVIPIATVTSRFINMLLSMLIVFAVVIFSGIKLSALAITFIPIVMIIQFVMANGFVLLLSGINVYYHDVEYLMGIAMMILIWMTPIMYSMDAIEGNFLSKIVYLNPMTSIIECYHSILYYGKCPSITLILIAAIVAVSMLVVGELCFIKMEKRFAEEL